MRFFWFEFAMLLAAIAALFVLLPRFKPQSKFIAALTIVAAVVLTFSNIYLKANTGLGLDDRIICTIYPRGKWCMEVLHSPPAPEESAVEDGSAGKTRDTDQGKRPSDAAQPVTPQPQPSQPSPTTPDTRPEPVRVSKPQGVASINPGEVFRDCPVCPEMVVVPAGQFLMGSPSGELRRDTDEGPQQRIAFGRRFAVGRFEVTFDEWDACVANNGCSRYRPYDRGWGRGRRPVINVSWNDAKAYVTWLSAHARKQYRLLSEAEWEYAARAGTMTPFSFGDTISTSQANYNGNYSYGRGRMGVHRERTTPFGSFSGNNFGIFDMHGNVREWTEDCWNNSLDGIPSGGQARLIVGCTVRVIRGGGWLDVPWEVRSAVRTGIHVNSRFSDVGFRVARFD